MKNLSLLILISFIPISTLLSQKEPTATGEIIFNIKNAPQTYSQSINNQTLQIWNLIDIEYENDDLQPHPPVSLRQTSSFGNPVLEWNQSPQSDDFVTGYKIYRKIDYENYFFVIGTVNSTTFSFEDNGVILNGGGHAYYKISAINNIKESGFSNQIDVSIVSMQKSSKLNQLANTSWPMLKHDPQLTGRGDVKGPQVAAYIKRYPLVGGVFSGPIIGYDDQIASGAYRQGKYYLFNMDGTIAFDYNSQVPFQGIGGTLITSDSSYYFISEDGNLYALNSVGELKWKFDTGTTINTNNLINIDNDCNLYFAARDGFLYSINCDSTFNWKVKVGSGFWYITHPAISNDGEMIYISGSDSNLYAYNTSGNLEWTYRTGKSTQPVVTDNNKILIQSSDAFLYSINSDGSLNWKYPGYYLEGTSPTIDKDGNISFIYFYHPNFKVISVDSAGNFLWKYEFEDPDEGFTQPLICDSEGTIYCGSTWGKNYYAIDNTGKLKWKIPLEGNEVDNTSAINSNGVLYIGVHGADFYNSLWAISDTNLVDINFEYGDNFSYQLFQNYPNPFNPVTTIRFEIPYEQQVELKIFDILGREVKTLYNDLAPAGIMAIDFKADDLASGTYIYRLKTNSFISTKKLLLLK
jgi:hypothetical protein